ncbi:uncharacterized protein C2845_PM03G28670 [Panicum miliaceum]|uniref:Uncharacterized protein n=1 Tax=Panicum miliaceum TaxID=4540 RepID=A0A3L6TCA5_PANMI|nr:uncharacterized protein C2845_PM03G28670 [Panicum miliaceum]
MRGLGLGARNRRTRTRIPNKSCVSRAAAPPRHQRASRRRRLTACLVRCSSAWASLPAVGRCKALQACTEARSCLRSSSLFSLFFPAFGWGQGMSNLDSTDAAAGSGTAEREPTAASVPALNGTPKCMRRRTRKRWNKLREQQDSPPGLDSMVAAEAEEQGEAKGRRMEEREAPDAAASALNGTMKCKNKKNKMQEQQESPPDSDSMVAAEAEEHGEAKGRGVEEREATDAAASALNGTPKCMKRRRNNRINMREQQDSPPGLDSSVSADVEEQGEAKGRGMEDVRPD